MLRHWAWRKWLPLFENEIFCILIQISLKFNPGGSTDNNNVNHLNDKLWAIVLPGTTQEWPWYVHVHNIFQRNVRTACIWNGVGFAHLNHFCYHQTSNFLPFLWDTKTCPEPLRTQYREQVLLSVGKMPAVGGSDLHNGVHTPWYYPQLAAKTQKYWDQDSIFAKSVA